MQQVIKLGSAQEVTGGFACVEFPNCIGAIDGTHVLFICPPHQASEFINRKACFSTVLPSLVDHHGSFTNIRVGWPGKVHGTRIFWNSRLFALMNIERFVPRNTMEINGVAMTPVILGDPIYPLLPSLIKPFIGQLDRKKEPFNYCLSGCRRTVELMFGR